MPLSPKSSRTLAGAAVRLARDARAATAIEFAIVAPLFIALILATLQVGIVFLAKSYLETGAEQGARLVLTNQAVTTSNGVTTPMTQAQFQAAICAQFIALFNCSQLIVQLEPLPSTATSLNSLVPQFNSNGTLKNPTTYATGSSGENMLLIVMYPWPVFGGPLGLSFASLGNGTLLLSRRRSSGSSPDVAGVPSALSALRSRLRAFRRDASGLAAVEAALLSPVALGLLGLVVFGGEGLSIQRKVTLASRTVADLVGQAPVSSTGAGSGTALLNQTDLDYYLSLSTLILYPYAASGVQAELSEVQVAGGGGATATVIWSEGYNGGVARPVGQIISIDPAIVSAGAGYLLLGEVQYAYQPLNIWQSVGAFTISDSIFMAPRSAAQISINWGY